jgi:nucleotide-binding universal stress UspA family protein
MFRKILVPVDLADRHTTALEFAARLAGPGGGEITLLHVIELIHGLSKEEDAAFYQRLERKAKQHLDRLLTGLQERQVTGRPAIVFGERIAEVLRYAHQEGTDLIVLTSHAVNPADPGAGWGTMSYLIGIAAHCPVLLAK